jgi:cell division protease FtsH
LEENKDKLNKLADVLIEKEVIFKDDLVNIFGERIFEKNQEHITEDIVYKNVE